MTPIPFANSNGWARRVLGLVTAAALCATTVPVWSAETALVMGVFPRRSAPVTEQMFRPLAEYLSKSLGREVRLETTQDFLGFWDQVTAERYDIVHYNQYHYLRSHRDHGYRVIARIREFGRDGIAAALVVRKDSGINTIADLRGRKIVFGGGKQAMVSYIMTHHLLASHGLNHGDYIAQFALNPPKACVAVYYRQGAAAGVGDSVLDMPVVREQVDVDELKVLATSRSVANLPWAVKATVPDEMALRIRNALVELSTTNEGRSLLDKAQLTGFLPASDGDYDIHRHIIEQVTGEKF